MTTGKRGAWGARVVLWCAVLLLAASGGAAAEKKDRKNDNPHGRKDARACIVCHLSQPAEGALPGRDNNIRFGGDIVALCSSCHAGYKHMHPTRIAVAPDMKAPEDLPLDKNGKITCITCHDVMQESGIHRRSRLVGRQLCLNCHVESEIFTQVNWYPARLARGEKGRLELKVVEFRINRRKLYLGDSVLLYYYAKNVDTGQISFGTNVLYDDGSHGDRTAHDSIYTLIEEAGTGEKQKRVMYTMWVLDSGGRKSNIVTIAMEFE